MPHTPETVTVITGPTGSGKTALAVAFARSRNAVIISADSRQIYRQMDIGTAKPDAAEREVPHYLIDIRNPDEAYSAGDFARDAGVLMDRFSAEGTPFLIVGGNGFYINALINGAVAGQPADKTVRDALRQRLDREGAGVLRAELAAHDPRSAQRIHPNDHYRLLRALEIITITGKPVAPIGRTGAGNANEGRCYRLAALRMDRSDLYARINRRVDAMLAAGLEDEVRGLIGRGYDRGLQALKTVGYQELFPYFDGDRTLDEAVEHIKMNSRRYAKRQLTWFRQRSVTWLDAAEDTGVLTGRLQQLAEEAC